MDLRAVIFAVAASTGAATVHPHGDADRIAQVSLGLEHVSLVLTVMPGVDDGGAIFDHIDLNGDRALNAEEGAAMAKSLLQATEVFVDGKAMSPSGAATVLPERTDRLGGTGAIVVEAAVGFPHLAAGEHEIAVSMEPDRFIQPYYFDDLATAAGTPELRRDGDGEMVSFTTR